MVFVNQALHGNSKVRGPGVEATSGPGGVKDLSSALNISSSRRFQDAGFKRIPQGKIRLKNLLSKKQLVARVHKGQSFTPLV